MSCSKQEVLINKPIKKDSTPPVVYIEQPRECMRVGDTCTARLVVTDNMALKAVYYYENGFLSRSFVTTSIPGRTATNWELCFPFEMCTEQTQIRVVCTDLAGNITEEIKTVKSVF
jgi:hypothetical protein